MTQGDPAFLGEVRKAECAKCRGPRRCGVRGTFAEPPYDLDFVQGEVVWRILQCLGCDHVFVEVCDTYTGDDWTTDPHGNQIKSLNEHRKYFPALAKRHKPQWLSVFGIWGMPVENLDKVLNEIYDALGQDPNLLAGMGIRTAFDVAAKKLGIDDGLTFQGKLKALREKRLIGAIDEANLGVLIDAGSAAAHRGWRPDGKQLNTLVEILELFIERAFVTPWQQRVLYEQAAKVKAVVPPRPGAKALKPPKTSQ